MKCKSGNTSEQGSDSKVNLSVPTTNGICPAGEKAGSAFISEGRIPVLSCEGPCIRGEIARLAANAVSKADGFARACHGEAFTVPHSAMAKWVRGAEKVVVIDGCFLKCHGRILQNIVGKKSLVAFDALSFYRKYTEFFEIDSVPEEERKATAREVADKILEQLNSRNREVPRPESGGNCGID